VVAIAVAFITNKLWVFDSKDTKKETVIAELVKFIIARVATGIIDLVIMFTAVDVMQLPAVIFKVIANVIVIILNYILSNILIFKKSDKTPAKKTAKKSTKE
jgi:putative flippase GtrA